MKRNLSGGGGDAATEVYPIDSDAPDKRPYFYVYSTPKLAVAPSSLRARLAKAPNVTIGSVSMNAGQ